MELTQHIVTSNVFHFIIDKWLDMPTVDLSANLTATNFLDAALFEDVSAIICAIPTKQMRSVLKQASRFITEKHLLIFVNKGIEADTLLLPNDVVIEELGDAIGKNASFLSGPSFAVEVVAHETTCVTVASSVYSSALRTQRLFHAPFFRVYVSTDVVGVEVAGALKNVMALASGSATGMGMQMNARTALITRALAEITRIGVKLGANPLTFAGLSGVGDLFLTCTSEKSRNFTVGARIAKGETIEQIIETLGSVAEGVATTPAAYALCRRLDVDSPIIDAVYAVVCEGKSLHSVLEKVVHRQPKPEIHY